jgi:hypothetical protein
MEYMWFLPKMWIRCGRCLGEDARDDRGDTVEDGAVADQRGAI